jgi:ribosomal protein S18 acetylase RimI-like enzyme
MDKDISIRQATIADLIPLRAIAMNAYKEFSSVLPPEHWERMRTGLENEETVLQLLKTGTALICEHLGELAGIAYLIPSGNPTQYFQADWAYIRLLGVLPEFRGLGLGRMLTCECIQLAKRLGERTLALHTSEFHNAARHIYEQLGFQKQREIGPLYGKRYWIYTLSL